MKYDVLIIGSGLAGLRAAISVIQHDVSCAVISLVYPVRSHSVAAQGGINAALKNVDKEDSWKGEIGNHISPCNNYGYRRSRENLCPFYKCSYQ